MHKTVFALGMLAATTLGVLTGCTDNARTTIPDSVTPDQVQQLEEDQKRVAELELQHQRSQQANP